MRYKFLLCIQAPGIILSFSTRITSDTQELVKIPLVDRICLTMLQFIRLKLAKINKRGVLMRSGERGISKNQRAGGRDVY